MTTLSESYIYRTLYMPYIAVNPYISIKEFLIIHNFNVDSLYQIGVGLSEPFISLGQIGIQFISDETKKGLFIEYKGIKTILDDNTFISFMNIPKISRPIPWTCVNKYYIGGNYRRDLYSLNQVHKNIFNSHNISNIDLTVSTINNKMNTPLCINKLSLDGIKPFVNGKLDIDTVFLAEFYSLFDFYIPQYLDWRGRIYTSSTYLSYQGSSLSKSLLLLCNGEVLNEVGLKSVIMYASELYGLKLFSNVKREKWFNKNRSFILDMDKDFIEKSDDIILFHNFCLYYSNYINSNQDKFCLPIFFDATCSGLQHISCLLEDIELGTQVNIGISSDIQDPKDIYTYLLEPIKQAIISFSIIDTNYSFFRYLVINRQFIKRIVMTVPYSITIYGIASQIKAMGEMIKIVSDLNPKHYKIIYRFIGTNGQNYDLNNNQIQKQASIIKKTIIDIYPKQGCLFTYYGDKISLLIKLGIPIEWTTPLGVIIRQSYLRTNEVKLNVRINKRSSGVILREVVSPNIIDSRKSRNAIVPNIIHSLDATHQISIVLQFIKVDKCIFTIHDCFLIHPNDYNLQYKTVVMEFVKIYYNKNFVSNFHSQNIDKIKCNYDIEVIDNVMHVRYGKKLIKIPTIFNIGNEDNFYKVLKESKYLIK